MTKNFVQSMADVHRLSHRDIKPLGAKLGKLMEEVGELAECVNIHQGFITHKVMKEPLEGEVADVVQCALAILVDANPELTKKECLDLFLEQFERKNYKWETVQEGDAERTRAAEKIRQEKLRHERVEAQRPPPEGDPSDMEHRVFKIVAEQLGLSYRDIHVSARFVEDLGADSLDLVELCMAIEDEFEMEISDRDAESIFTVRELLDYVRMRFGIELVTDRGDDDLGEEDLEERAQAVEADVEKPAKYYDPAAAYTEQTGRHLSLEERMQERSLFRDPDRNRSI